MEYNAWTFDVHLTLCSQAFAQLEIIYSGQVIHSTRLTMVIPIFIN